MEPGTDPADTAGSDPTPYVTVTRAPTPGKRRSRLAAAGVVVLAVALVALVLSQLSLLSTLDAARTDLDDALAGIAVLESEVASLDRSVAALDEDLDELAAVGANGGASTAPSLPAGVLPRYVEGAADTALGLTLGALEAPDGYSGTTVRVDPADGRKRVWMVWAHWCPYCQEELPLLATLYPDLAETYPDVELTTVTTSIDPTRGNPLGDYLEAEAFPFPVLVDESSEISARLGVSAFPFWVVTDGDGTVLYRSAGYLGEARVVELLATLAAYES